MDKQQGTLDAAPRRPTRARRAARALVTAGAAAVVVGAGLLAEALFPADRDPALIAPAPLQAAAPPTQPTAMSRPVQAAPAAPPAFAPLAAADPGASARAPAAHRQRLPTAARRAEATRSAAVRKTLRGGSSKVAVAAPPQAAAPVAPAPAWPDRTCDQPITFARELCMAVQCATADFSRHPVCVRMQADRRGREQLARSMGAP